MARITGIAPGAAGPANTHDEVLSRTTVGALTMPAIFSDGMVLQRDTPVAVWSSVQCSPESTEQTPQATPKTHITQDAMDEPLQVTLTDAHHAVVWAQTVHWDNPADTSADNADISADTTADTSTDNAAHTAPYRTWLLQIPSQPAGTGYTLTIEHGNDRMSYRDVAFGDVWIAAGQSNMELELQSSADADETIATANDPLLRYFLFPKTGTLNEEAEQQASWRAAQPATIGTMSAVAYYAAQRMRQRHPDVPVGIIGCYVGGTSISCWMSREALNASEQGRAYVDRYDAAIAGRTRDELRQQADDWQRAFDNYNATVADYQRDHPGVDMGAAQEAVGAGPWPPPVTPFSPWHCCGPFEAMVQRIAPYTVAGVMWYQGEEDEPYASSYEHLLTDMRNEWRHLFNTATTPRNNMGNTIVASDDLPFVIAQLPQFIDDATAQTGHDMSWPTIRAAQALPAHRSVTVPLIDCGEYNNIHPGNKRPVGERLGEAALAILDDIRTGTNALNEHRTTAIFPTFPVMERAEICPNTRAKSCEISDACERTNTVRVYVAHSRGLHWDFTRAGMVDPSAAGQCRKELLEQLPARQLTAEQSDGFPIPAQLTGFEVVADGTEVPVSATIRFEHGTTGDAVVELHVNTMNPSEVRYAWHSWGPAPLCNADGLPLAPGTIAVQQA